jgi:N-methylhydantoinase B
MDATLVRTAMSPGIREQGDAFPLIADHLGRMIVGQFGSFIGGFLEGYDGTLEDGDMIFLSDPYSVGGAISHSNDWLVLLPVFKDGRLLAYTAMFGHQSDIGGKVARLDADRCDLDLRGRRAHPAGEDLQAGRI